MKEFKIIKYDVLNNQEEVINFIVNIVVNEFNVIKLKDYYQNEFINLIKDISHQFFVAKNEDDKIVGICGYFESNTKEARLSSFYVDSDYRSYKVGKNLFDTCIDFVRKQGYQDIILRTSSVWDKAIKFYERNNFKLYKTDENMWYKLEL